MSFLQSDATFFALRHPANAPSPLRFDAPYTPTLVFRDTRVWPYVDLVTIPMELRPERQAFVESELPSAPGQQWLALGLAAPPAADCGAVPDLAGGEWEFQVEMYFDLGGGPSDGVGEVLPIYYCYEGQDPPFFFQMLSRALAGEAGLTSGQGQGVTYIGPQPLHLEVLTVPPSFELHLTNVAHISPAHGITLPHWLANWGGAPVTVDLDYGSTLGAPWSIVSGTQAGPDLPLSPITGPITLPPFSGPGDRRYIWLLAQTPEETEAGAYNLTITATDVTSPALYIWTSDLLWAGEWVAPPLGDGYRVYLPLVLRGSEGLVLRQSSAP